MLGLWPVLERAMVLEMSGVPMLETLLMDTSNTPLNPEIRTCDMVAVAAWYIWWERRRATHGESIQAPQRTTQSIMVLALHYKRAKKNGAWTDRETWLG